MHAYFYYIALSMIPGMGSVNTKQLISYCGDAESVFKQKKSHLLKIPGIGSKTAENLLQSKVFNLAEKEISFCEKHQIKIIPFIAKDFPARLLHCFDCPVLLYQKGELDLNPPKTLAVVGTRNATRIGRDFVESFMEDLSSVKVQITSGMALGIDAVAHASSLKYGLDTVGVLGHPLNTMYPASNQRLARDMIDKGNALLTEYPSNAEIVPANFPMRNRIVAGLSDATLVVESAEKGGAIITAYLANSYNRDVFAVPGRFKDRYAKGCNKLIKELKANLVENAQDVIRHMSWEEQLNKPKKIQRNLALDLTADEAKIIEVLREQDAMESDHIIQLTALSPGKMATILLELELRGIVYSLPGNRFSLN